MKNMRKWWIAAAVAVVVTAVAGIGAGVMAQTPVPGDESGTSMLDRVAGKLGISSDTLSEAIETSAMEEIDERVAAGDLTQEEADAIKERLAELPDDALIGPGGHHRRFGFGDGEHPRFGFSFRFDFGFGGASANETGLAEFLGVTVDQLAEELAADGATLATVAEAHGKSRDELKAFFVSGLEARLDERVAAGDLTQERADAIAAKMTEHLDAIIDGTLGFRGGPGFWRRPFGGPEERPFEGDAPTTEPTTVAAAGSSIS